MRETDIGLQVRGESPPCTDLCDSIREAGVRPRTVMFTSRRMVAEITEEALAEEMEASKRETFDERYNDPFIVIGRKEEKHHQVHSSNQRRSACQK